MFVPVGDVHHRGLRVDGDPERPLADGSPLHDHPRRGIDGDDFAAVGGRHIGPPAVGRECHAGRLAADANLGHLLAGRKIDDGQAV